MEAKKKMKVKIKIEKGGIPPFKKYKDDVGYDLYLVELIEKKGNFYFYDTKIRVEPPPGYYIEIVPRSSLSKTGFVMANSIGIIDPQYRGTIKVALRKIDENAPDLKLPFRGVQMILRKLNLFDIEVVDKLSETERKEGGFGSTGHK